jgi:hypothetical protein
MHHYLRIAVAIAALLFMANAGAETRRVTSEELDRGVSLAGQARAGEFPMYALVIDGGEGVEIYLDGPGKLGLTVYGPGAKVVLRKDGQGSVSDRLVAPADGLYLVSVGADAGAKFSLAMKRVAGAASVARPAPAPVPAPAPEPAPPAIDPNWGVYARVAGTTGEETDPTNAPYELRWVWEVPGQVLVESWYKPGRDKATWINRIERDPSTGVLLSKTNFPFFKNWDGRVASDGSVQWVGSHSGKMPYRVYLTPDGQFASAFLKKNGEQRPLSSWRIVGTPTPAPSVAASSGATPIAAPASSPAPTSAAAPTRAQLDAGYSVSGEVGGSASPKYVLPARSGDAFEIYLDGSGPLELSWYGPGGKLLGSKQGNGSVSTRLDAASDGDYSVSIMANSGAKYSLAMKRFAKTAP